MVQQQRTAGRCCTGMSNNLWEYFKSLFHASQNSSAQMPFLHELIDRSEEERQDLERWKSTLVCRRLLDWLGDQYAIFSVAPDEVDDGIDFLDTPSSKGFVIHFYKTRYSRRDVTHFLDLLKEKVLRLPYKPQISDSRTFTRGERVETIERHYLKPRPDLQREGPFDQQYGNVLIELHLRDEQPHYLKFSATVYNDRLFQDAAEFRGLFQALIN